MGRLKEDQKDTKKNVWSHVGVDYRLHSFGGTPLWHRFRNFLLMSIALEDMNPNM